MYNTTQPFINLANSNMAAFTRLTQSPELPQIPTHHSAGFLQRSKGFFADASQAGALAEWSRTILDNYARFVNELTQSFFGMAGQGQAFIVDQTRELSRDFQDGLDEIVRAEESVGDALNTEQPAVIPLEAARQKRKAA